ncbi:MAG: DUF2764 domain-containing protein [Bacteroidales bacterium]|nr:DUF2764 domain-containing protein [Bacteroidales bacterium]
MGNNYEYIISSLPAVSLDWKGAGGTSDSYVDWIRTQLGAEDNRTLDVLLDGFKDENLTEEFYRNALGHGNSFIRNYFTFDLCVRNGKARFLNKAFGMPADQDTINIWDGEFIEAGKLQEALEAEDLITREKNLDDLMWRKIEEITTFNYFDLDVVLAFVAKLHIIYRWLSLDPETGKEMFDKLEAEIRGTFTGVDYKAPEE